jgi:phage terminase small subunit
MVITHPVSKEGYGMLTSKQNSFVQEMSSGSSGVDAYKSAYQCAGMSPKTIWEASSRLSKNPKVVARLDELRVQKEVQERMLRLSYGDFVINELQELALNAKSDKARIKALELLGKTVGLFQSC